MNVFVMMNLNNPSRVVWTRKQAEILMATKKYDRFEVVPINPVRFLVDEYFRFRGLKFPTEDQAFKFLTSEIGEFADASVSLESQDWVRNNPENKEASVQKLNFERGDILMMTIATGFERNVDALECMMDKFRSKGYTNE